MEHPDRPTVATIVNAATTRRRISYNRHHIVLRTFTPLPSKRLSSHCEDLLTYLVYIKYLIYHAEKPLSTSRAASPPECNTPIKLNI